MLGKVKVESTPLQDEFKASLYDFFEQELSKRHISLGSGSGSFDADRQSIDTVIIHHTSQPPGLSAPRLSAIELLRLYAPYYTNPPSPEDKDLSGKPIKSGHVRNGQQVFWPYHWIIRNDGRAERLLRDNEIGWHSGDWNVNCRSVAVALDNDYERSRPGEVELGTVARLIADHYGNVPDGRVLGHREVNSKTICPSRLFLVSNRDGWKQNLLSLLKRFRRKPDSGVR